MRTMALTLLLSVVGSVALATPNLWKSDRTEKVERTVNKDCPDFTGNWEGTCKYGKEESKTHMHIVQQGCGSIGVHNFQMPIGGITSVTQVKRPAGERGATYDAVNTDVEWKHLKKGKGIKNPQQELVITDSYVLKHLDLDSEHEDLNILNSVNVFKLDGKNLIMTSKVVTRANEVHEGTCEFSKAN